MTYRLSVDLGTTYSAAAVNRDGHVEIATLSASNPVMPSVVVLREDGELIVGEAAVRRGLLEPTRMAREFKRRLGDPTPIRLGGTPFGADALMGALLREIVKIVSVREGGPPEHVVLTHPANFGPYKLEAMREVARIGGLDLAHTSFLPEPQAAAISYAARDRVEPGTLVAVYDLGGGTFDAAVLRKTATGFDLLGVPEGLDRFGGIDIDEAILGYVTDQFGDQIADVDQNDPVMLSALHRLRDDCRAAKEALSTDTDTSIDVAIGSVNRRIRLTRPELESMIRPRLRDTTDALRRAITAAGVDNDDIDRVLLVGGSARTPLVAELVQQTTGRPAALDAHPKFAIAMGAAGSLDPAATVSMQSLALIEAPTTPAIEFMPAAPPPPPIAVIPAPQPERSLSRPAAPPLPPTRESFTPVPRSPAPKSGRNARLAVASIAALLVAGGVIALATRSDDSGDKASSTTFASGSSTPGETSGSTATAVSGPTSADPSATDSAAIGQPFAGTIVRIAGTLRDTDADSLQRAWEQFEASSGIDVQYTSATNESDILDLADGGSPPDLALVSRATMSELAGRGRAVPLDLQSTVEANDLEGAAALGTIDGTFYAPPFDIDPGSLVWYSPAAFDAARYDVPVTFASMLDLSQRIVDDGGTPWCLGAESGNASGWPITYWLDDVVARSTGVVVYDQWVAHEVPFSDPAILDAMDKTGMIVNRDDFVNGGTDSISTAPFATAGLPLLNQGCFLFHQAEFYRSLFPGGTTFGPTGDINAFYLPPEQTGDPRPMIAGGTFVTALADRPEVAAVAEFLTSAEYANERMALGEWYSPNIHVDPSVMTDPFDRGLAEIIASCDAYRGHATDLFPRQVGSGTFWSEMISWVDGKSTADVAAAIDDSFPT